MCGECKWGDKCCFGPLEKCDCGVHAWVFVNHDSTVASEPMETREKIALFRCRRCDNLRTRIICVSKV